jgi:elongation factor G
LGELHLEIAADRIRKEFGVACVAGRGAVAYRETIEGCATETFTVRRPVGPKSEFAEVTVSVTPGAPSVGDALPTAIDLGDPIPGNVVARAKLASPGGVETVSVQYLAPLDEIPSEFREAVLAGVFEALERGVITAHPMTDVIVRIEGGAYHPVDSCNSAYKLAGYRATINALLAARPLVLEPLMSVDVVTPDDSVGDVIADLHTRRGKITGITARPGVQTVACFVPMACMFGYSTDLRSKTRGRATCSLRFDHYQPVPKAIRDELSSKKSPK